jgi:alanine-glyoxylate transaminase / (R)-3-amino-2-methylpropionate-pyruvate transaminase
MDSQTVRAKHREFILPSVANYYEEPVVLASGKGSRVKDLDGHSYLDFFGGILTNSLGQCHDKVNTAVIAQMQRLGHVSTLYPTQPMVTLAETLVAIAPGKVKKAFFSASGTEADETAVALAQVFTGATELIALRHGYSGRSMLAQSLVGHGAYRAVPTQIAGIKHGLSPYCYRCPMKLEARTCGTACAKDLDELIRTTTTGRIAGMLAEPIQGVGGFITPPRDYFEIAAEIVRKHGGMMIIDEVQTGFGRTGKMWGAQQFNVEPDIMTMAKGIANGFPLGATLCTAAIGDAYKSGNISTYGGNPICSTAALAVIDTILEEKLVDNAAQQGGLLREGLVRLQRKHPKTIGEVRGMGLMQGVELVADETVQDRTPNTKATLQLFEETKKRGLLIGKGGLYNNAIRISPALNISKGEVEECLSILEESLAAMVVG